METFKPKPDKSLTPHCPVCHIPLEGCGNPIPASGVGQCPNGGLYAFETNPDQMGFKQDKFGRMVKTPVFDLDPIEDRLSEADKERYLEARSNDDGTLYGGQIAQKSGSVMDTGIKHKRDEDLKKFVQNLKLEGKPIRSGYTDAHDLSKLKKIKNEIQKENKG